MVTMKAAKKSTRTIICLRESVNMPGAPFRSQGLLCWQPAVQLTCWKFTRFGAPGWPILHKFTASETLKKAGIADAT